MLVASYTEQVIYPVGSIAHPHFHSFTCPLSVITCHQPQMTLKVGSLCAMQHVGWIQPNGVKTLRTQHISAPSDWLRQFGTCRIVPKCLGSELQSVLTPHISNYLVYPANEIT